MPSFLLFNKLQTFYGQTGQLLAGGYLQFFETDTTTPKSVYGERALSTDNGAQVALDSSGRLVHECWADTDDAYFVEIYDASDVKQGEVSYIEVPGGAAQTIPIPDSGEFITGDGSNFILATIREVPDPTGNSNKILGTDGTDLNWVSRPSDGEAGESDIGADDDGLFIGDVRITKGTGTGTSSGGRTQTVSVTFPVAFASEPWIVIPTVSNSSLSTSGNMPTHSVTAKSASGCTIQFRLSELDDDGSTWDFNAGVSFSYIAIGPKA